MEVEWNGSYSKEAWDNFCSNYLLNLNYIYIGRTAYAQSGRWFYSGLDCYSLKFYSRALTEEEVAESYKKTVSYHEFLEQQAKKEVDGD